MRLRELESAQYGDIMLGAITGDIVGSIYEWHNIKTKDFPLFTERNSITDDSVLTVALADAILNNSDYGRIMREYYRRYPYVGYGGSFLLWARDLLQGYTIAGKMLLR